MLGVTLKAVMSCSTIVTCWGWKKTVHSIKVWLVYQSQPTLIVTCQFQFQIIVLLCQSQEYIIRSILSMSGVASFFLLSRMESAHYETLEITFIGLTRNLSLNLHVAQQLYDTLLQNNHTFWLGKSLIIRPIVSCSSGPTENLSGHLCQILSAHLDRVPTLVKNSQQAISILQAYP